MKLYVFCSILHIAASCQVNWSCERCVSSKCLYYVTGDGVKCVGKSTKMKDVRFKVSVKSKCTIALSFLSKTQPADISYANNRITTSTVIPIAQESALFLTTPSFNPFYSKDPQIGAHPTTEEFQSAYDKNPVISLPETNTTHSITNAPGSTTFNSLPVAEADVVMHSSHPPFIEPRTNMNAVQKPHKTVGVSPTSTLSSEDRFMGEKGQVDKVSSKTKEKTTSQLVMFLPTTTAKHSINTTNQITILEIRENTVDASKLPHVNVSRGYSKTTAINSSSSSILPIFWNMGIKHNQAAAKPTLSAFFSEFNNGSKKAKGDAVIIKGDQQATVTQIPSTHSTSTQETQTHVPYPNATTILEKNSTTYKHSIFHPELNATEPTFMSSLPTYTTPPPSSLLPNISLTIGETTSVYEGITSGTTLNSVSQDIEPIPPERLNITILYKYPIDHDTNPFNCQRSDRLALNFERSLCRSSELANRMERKKRLDPALQQWMADNPAYNKTDICTFLRNERMHCRKLNAISSNFTSISQSTCGYAYLIYVVLLPHIMLQGI